MGFRSFTHGKRRARLRQPERPPTSGVSSYRRTPTPHARTGRKLIEYPEQDKDVRRLSRRLEAGADTQNRKQPRVRAIRINVSGTRGYGAHRTGGRLDEWCADNLKYFADTFGKENIVAAHLHRDEETPHTRYSRPHRQGRAQAQRTEEQTKKRYRKPTDTVRLCADDIMTAESEVLPR